MTCLCCTIICCNSKTISPENHLHVEEAQSVSAFAGKLRVKLVWTVPENQENNRVIIYRDNKSDSLHLQVAASGFKDSVIINNLKEGDHQFSILLLDQYNNRSEDVVVKETAYGEQYMSSLHNRPIRNIAFNRETNTANIEWGDAGTGATGSMINYKDSLGIARELFVPVYMNKTFIKDINNKTDSLIFYRTAFLPERTAIDTFYTHFDTTTIPFPAVGNELDAGYTHARLNADGTGSTYELINSILGGNAEETPDCSHPVFERHIQEEFNTELKSNVFAFYLHVSPDNDRCVNYDRQRCEIKTYGPSPDSLKAFKGDEMIFKWKFKLDAAFQPSQSFTHIHQIKAGDGANDGSPILTITPRYGNPDKLQIIHTGDSKSSTKGKVEEVDLSPFKGTWIQAVEKITFGTHGTYSLELKSVADGKVLLTYSNEDIDFWRTGSTFIRPKWGIYRSLNDAERLRDEKVLFADFIIEKRKQ